MKNKRSKKPPIKKSKGLRAIKFSIHNAEVKPRNVYRYVIDGILVTDKPLPGLKPDDGGDWILEGVETEENVFAPIMLIETAFGSLRLRKANRQGLSADQRLTSLQDM